MLGKTLRISRMAAVALALLLIPIPDSLAQDLFVTRDSPQFSRCYDDRGRPLRCIPEFVNAAFNVRVEVTNTCGLRGPTEYCLQTGVTGAQKSCEVCDTLQPHLSHPPEYLTDFNNNENQTWWQSETMLEGIQYPNQVNLTLHLGKSFDITYVRLKFHTSRPESFAIFKRTGSGEEWIPYQYYSATCRDTYGISDQAFVSKDDETRALCTSEFSDISPLTGGNVAFSTLEGRPSAYDFEHSPVLQEWVTATDIRITLERVNTFGDEIFGDTQVLKSYYYGVSDFAVGGRCKCHGHANECVVIVNNEPPWQRSLACRCEHNTAGADCEICLPFYNDQPWARSTDINVHECQPCNCNGRSNKCYFDAELWHLTGHGGHCFDCIDNTDGPNCERCRDNYYEREDTRCVPCNCDPIGSRSLQCNNKGHCQCKPGVEGQRCHKCAANFYDFSDTGCRPCGCNVAGSVDNTPSCDTITGICQCKDNVEGQRCDQCNPGFFDLQASNEFGCLPCFCFGHSSICRSSTGYTSGAIESAFFRDKEKWRVFDYSGNELQFQYNPTTQDISATASSREAVYFVAPDRYLGDQRSIYNQLLHFTFRVSEEGPPQATLEDIILEGAGLSISLPIFGQGNPLPTTLKQEYKFRLHENLAYGWNPRLASHDFMTILSNLTALKIKASYSPQGTGSVDNVLLENALRSPSGDAASWIEMCTCPEGYVGQFCESCAPGYHHDPPSGGKFARCVPCNCHGHAEYCDPENGRCICQHNTAGDNCERCASGYYGDALLEIDDACIPCPCPEGGACVILPDEEVACLECPEGYAGHRCNLCVDGYFGELADEFEDAFCQPCQCNNNVDTNAIGNCDRVTGECLKCVNNTSGPHCESCLPGYYGDALKVPKGDCKACNCFFYGTEEIEPTASLLVCNYKTGQCPCMPNVIGKQCDLCEEGYWNIASGLGCESCECDPVGAYNHTCDVPTGQCLCRPGITGKRCNECLPYHYGFSEDGCEVCECDPIGSVSPQCRNDGQCECRINFVGRMCDKCKENAHDKLAGCINCPPCYNLVQDAADAHRVEMAKLAELLKAIQENPHLVDDEDFIRRLGEIEERVNSLLDDAQKTSGQGSNVAEKLKDFHKRLSDVKKSVDTVSGKIEEVNTISDYGQHNISIAEDVIKNAQEALASARKFLETEGVSALEEAIERSNKFGEQSDRMSEIAREARTLADEHEKQAAEVATTAANATNISKTAYEQAQEAINTQGETSARIKDLDRNVDITKSELENAQQAASASNEAADKAYEEALDLYTDSYSITVPDIEPEAMSERSADIIKQAKEIQERVAASSDENNDLLDQVEKQRQDAEELLVAGERQQQIADEMFADTEKALTKAQDAVASGEKILTDAKETLETLRGFDQQVQQSRETADSALTRVPDIERLIEQAEDKTLAAQDALSGAELGAKEARHDAQEAQSVAEQASNDADTVLAEAENTKEQTNKLKEQADELANQVEETDGRVKEYEDQAGSDETLVKEALERANQAKTSANDAFQKVKNALETVDDILRSLDGLDEFDTSLLDQLDEKLNQAEKNLKDADFEPRLLELRKAREQQHHWMKDYSEEVKKMQRDVENVADIAASLPDQCYRKIVLEP